MSAISLHAPPLLHLAFEQLVELGRMKTVGGQEDMIEDVALDMKKAGAAE